MNKVSHANRQLNTIPFDSELTPGARNAVRVCLRIQPSERVTVITDEASIEIAAHRDRQTQRRRRSKYHQLDSSRYFLRVCGACGWDRPTDSKTTRYSGKGGGDRRIGAAGSVRVFEYRPRGRIFNARGLADYSRKECAPGGQSASADLEIRGREPSTWL